MPLMIHPRLGPMLHGALQLQARTGQPHLTIRNTPVIHVAATRPTVFNKSCRLKRVSMDEAMVAEVRQRTGYAPFIEVTYQ